MKLDIVIQKNGQIVEGNPENLPALGPDQTLSGLKAHHGVRCPDCGTQGVNAMSGWKGTTVCYQAICSQCGLKFSCKSKQDDIHPFEVHNTQQNFEHMAYIKFMGCRLDYKNKDLKRIK